MHTNETPGVTDRRYAQIESELRTARVALRRAISLAAHIDGDAVMRQGLAESAGRVEAALTWTLSEIERQRAAGTKAAQAS